MPLTRELLWSGLILAMAGRLWSAPAEPIVHMLAPGFDVQELPVKLSNVNNLRFAPDGRLTALGYDGRIHLLRDTDGDGLEDHDDLFWDQPSLSVPVGMVWAPEGLYVSSHGKVSLLRDTDGDGKADREEIIASGWPATDVGSGGVDATAVTRDLEGNLYFGLLVANYANAYRLTNGVAHYDVHSLRGTIQKWNRATGKLETISTGIRVPYTLAFNRAGDLFVTDQEGETWMPNGNPLDELNWVMPGKNYGFPPRHERYLPGLISEPPVVGFGPQHQSTCGLVFDERAAGHPLFGPEIWEDNALVAGESRGKIWRVQLAKTPDGYVGKEKIIARLGMLTLDLAISPRGDLYVACHSGQPDWGTGPGGPGKIFRIRYSQPTAPQPVAIWPANLMEVRVAFDRPIDRSVVRGMRGQSIEFGEYVRAADRLEVLKPPYEAVKRQEATPRGKLKVVDAELSSDGRTLILKTDPHPVSAKYALSLPGIKAVGAEGAGELVDVDYDFEGVSVGLEGDERDGAAEDWWPHPVGTVAREFLRGSGIEERMREAALAGSWRIRTWLDFPKGRQVLRLTGKTVFSVEAGVGDGSGNGRETGGGVRRTGRVGVPAGALAWPKDRAGFLSKGTGKEVEVSFESTGEPVPLEVRFEKEGKSLPELVRFAYRSDDDPTWRVVPISRLRVPWAPPRMVASPVAEPSSARAEDGDYERGRSLFFGERLKCATCHRIRGEGGAVGPDLSNLPQRDAATVLRDIREPSALINPDYVAFHLITKDGEDQVGFVRAQDAEAVTVLGADGKSVVVPRGSIRSVAASSVSLMPAGLLDSLKEGEVRDLLTFLCNAPPARDRSDFGNLAKAGGVEAHATGKRLRVILVASKQDHGSGQHDYPAWQRKWAAWLSRSEELAVDTAWEWPSPVQVAEANVLVFYYWNHQWSPERLGELDNFLQRGGGIVSLHSACIADQAPQVLAERLGLAAQPTYSKYRHCPVHLKLSKDGSGIMEGFPERVDFLDETYWPTVQGGSGVTILGTAVEEGRAWPMVWTREAGAGRVFGSILGHYTWTWSDPVFRRMILRGLAWVGHEPVTRFENLAGVEMGVE